MPRFNFVADAVNLAITCPKCGKVTDKPVSWLVNESILPCDGCGGQINLKAGDNRRRIEEVAREAGRVQAALTKAGDSR